jgi:hypothetical protein
MQMNSAYASFATAVGLSPERLGRSAKAAEVFANARAWTLPKGQVIRLDSSIHARAVTVHRGTIWLTATPALGDVIVPAGETHLMTGQGPWVIEALETSELGTI